MATRIRRDYGKKIVYRAVLKENDRMNCYGRELVIGASDTREGAAAMVKEWKERKCAKQSFPNH